MPSPFDPGEDEPHRLPATGEADADLDPWDIDPPPRDPDAPRERHDAFTHRRRAEFLRALAKTGCIAEACRRSGVAPRTIYRHQGQDGEFLDQCVTAQRMAALPLEMTAWRRAVDGVEETVVVGGRATTRTRYSEGLLRLLLKGADPKRFGPNPGFSRKRLAKAERKQIEQEVRAEHKAKLAKGPDKEELVGDIMKLVNAVRKRKHQEQVEAGWTEASDGTMIPPGYGPLDRTALGDAAAGGLALPGGDPPDSV